MNREQLETAAQAAFLAFQHDLTAGGQARWEDVPEEMRVTFRMVADAVLMTALPRLLGRAVNRDALVELFNAHLWTVDADNWPCCACGEPARTQRAHQRHLADALLPLVAADHIVHVTAAPIAEDVVWCDECEEWVTSGAPERRAAPPADEGSGS